MADWPEMRRFLKENYRPGYVLLDPPLFAWQFRHAAENGSANIVCAYDGERLVGILGYMPFSVFWGDTHSPVKAVWMANWMVEEKYRTGIGAILMRRLMELYPILLGQGASGINRPIAERLGFRMYHEIPRYVALFDRVRASAYRISEDVSLPDIWARHAESTGIVTQLPDNYDPDWSRYPDLRFGTVRSSEFMQRRYFSHPVFDYEVMLLGDVREPAVCVFRIEQTSGVVEDKVGRIAEFFFPATEDGESRGIALMRAVLAELNRQGCVFADIYCTAPLFSKALLRAGMTAASGQLLATRMNPVELKARDQNMEIWARPDLVAPPDLTDLYIMKSDGDQDRPN